MKVDIFIPCFIDQFYPETGLNMVKILERLKVEVYYNNNQTCCGQTAFKTGFWDEAKAVGEKFIQDFSNNRYVVSPSASCTGMVRNYYDNMFYNSALHNEYRLLKKNIFEITDFLVNVMKVTDLGAVFQHVVTIHDSCTALREIGSQKEARLLLEKVQGIELRELKQPQECCGFGGIFAVKNEAISTAMAEQKVGDAIATGAEYIVSTDASCLLHFDGFISKNKLPIKTIHIVDVLVNRRLENTS